MRLARLKDHHAARPRIMQDPAVADHLRALGARPDRELLMHVRGIMLGHLGMQQVQNLALHQADTRPDGPSLTLRGRGGHHPSSEAVSLKPPYGHAQGAQAAGRRWKLTGVNHAAFRSPTSRHSHALARLAALEAARGSFEAAHAAITSRCGPVIGKRQIEQAVVNAADDIAAFYAARIPMPCTASTLLVISADSRGS
jgi:hypothetical protein